MATATNKYTSKIANNKVLILGGTSGIGFCVAEAALESGASIIISSSRQAKLDNALERLRKSYPDIDPSKIKGHTCDLAQPDNLESSLEALLTFATSDSQLNHVAYTAGDMFDLLPLREITVDFIHKCEMVRLTAALMLAKLLPKYMVVDYTSSITLTGGSNTDKPVPGWVTMAACGGAVEAATRGLAVELKPVRVNLVSPGAVHTELFDAVGADKLDAFMKHAASQTLAGRVGRPEDVAEAYIYLMRDRFATGRLVHSDGGRLLV